MNEDRLDLSPLDPTADAARWESLALAIRKRAAPELARRSSRASVLGTLGYWAWPALAAAAVVALLSGSAIALVRPPMAWGGVIQALELSEPVSVWLDEQRAPTTTDLLVAVQGGGSE